MIFIIIHQKFISIIYNRKIHLLSKLIILFIKKKEIVFHNLVIRKFSQLFIKYPVFSKLNQYIFSNFPTSIREIKQFF